jgi:hypothetical protein
MNVLLLLLLLLLLQFRDVDSAVNALGPASHALCILLIMVLNESKESCDVIGRLMVIRSSGDI